MKKFRVTGFSASGVWKFVIVSTIFEMAERRALERGLVSVTSVEEI